MAGVVPIPAPSSFDYYVDSANGNDSNSGSCNAGQVAAFAWSACAFKTPVPLMTALSGKGGGKKICLTYGSYLQNQTFNFAESLSQSDATNLTLSACGDMALAKPTVDAAQIISAPGNLGSWTSDGMGAYSISITTPVPAGTDPSGFSVFENAGSAYAFLVPETTKAACDSTPGSYYTANLVNWVGGTQTVYVHPTSGSPLTNNFSYKVTSQVYAINTWFDSAVSTIFTNPTITNIITCCQAGNNGSLVLGAGGTATGGQANFGGKHNMLVASQTTVTNYSLTAANVLLSGNMFIEYDDFASGGPNAYVNITVDGTGSVGGAPSPGYDCHFGSGALGTITLGNWTLKGGLGTGLAGQIPYTANVISCDATITVCLAPNSATYSNVTSHATLHDVNPFGSPIVINGTNVFSSTSQFLGTTVNISGTTFNGSAAGIFFELGANITSTGNTFNGSIAYQNDGTDSMLVSNNNNFFNGSSANPGYWQSVLRNQAAWLGLGFDGGSTFH